MESEVHACITKMRIVERLEGVETISIFFRCPVASEQPPAEIYTYFRHYGMSVDIFKCGKLNTGDKVFLAVSAQLSYRKL